MKSEGESIMDESAGDARASAVKQITNYYCRQTQTSPCVKTDQSHHTFMSCYTTCRIIIIIITASQSYE